MAVFWINERYSFFTFDQPDSWARHPHANANFRADSDQFQMFTPNTVERPKLSGVAIIANFFSKETRRYSEFRLASHNSSIVVQYINTRFFQPMQYGQETPRTNSGLAACSGVSGSLQAQQTSDVVSFSSPSTPTLRSKTKHSPFQCAPPVSSK